MRWLVAVILLVPLASATSWYLPGPREEPDLVDGVADFLFQEARPQEGRVEANQMIALTGWSHRGEVHLPEDVFTTEDANWFLFFGCNVPMATYPGALASMTLQYNGTVLGRGSGVVPTTCMQGETYSVVVPLETERTMLPAGSVVGVTFSLPYTNLPGPEQVWIAIGPTYLDLPWLPEAPPLILDGLSLQAEWHDWFDDRLETTWETDAENVTVTVQGELNGEYDISLRPSEGPSIRFSGSAWNLSQNGYGSPSEVNDTFRFEAGFDSEFAIQIDVRGAQGKLRFEFLPETEVPLNITDTVPEVTHNEPDPDDGFWGTDGMTVPAGPKKDSPVPMWPLIVALALMRRR